MKNKKIISMILVIIMVVSTAIIANAAEVKPIPSLNNLLSTDDGGKKATIALTTPRIDTSSADKVLSNYAKSVYLDGVSNIIIKDHITVDGKEAPLYRVFENQDKAISDIKIKLSDFLSKIVLSYALNPISDENWKEYREKACQYISEHDDVIEGSYDYIALNNFFDIYENVSENQNILDYVTAKRDSLKLQVRTLTSDDTTLMAMLPYNSDVVQKFNEKALNNSSMAVTAAYDKYAAITYAAQYAVNGNDAGYGVPNGGDCTNFTSQILEAGGVPQQVYDSESMGWWHKKNGSNSYSISWIQARTFARYMGIGYSTTDHYWFSYYLQDGDFIGFDNTGDGNVDHVGFVVHSDTYVGTYGGKTYYDYIVAQHSDNYFRWTSDINNNWENQVGTYVRIRR